MTSVLNSIGEGLSNAFLMAWDVRWALVLGFTISGIVQAWVPRERIERALGDGGARGVSLATGLGAASSSCSYAAVAIARALFAGGASAAAALAFQFASTNLVVELGVLLWILIGWQFTLAEFVGGLVLIVLMTLLLRVFISRSLERQAREHAQAAEQGHRHHSAGAPMSLRRRIGSMDAWSDVAHNFRNDWAMLYKEILLGFVLAGFVGLLGDSFFNSLFAENAPAALRLAENVLVGPLIAVLSFVCSVGNVPLAAVLWSGGIGFAGVISFIFADLIIVPIVAIYCKYYGRRFAARIVALMFVTMVLAALAVTGLFSLAGLIPETRPSRAEIFSGVTLDYRLFTNALATVIFAAMFALTLRRGATDPGCGMKVDRRRAIPVVHEGHTQYVCSQSAPRSSLRMGLRSSRHRRPTMRDHETVSSRKPLFFFGVMSPYSWFAAERIERVLPDAQWRGVLAGAVFQAHDRVSWGLTEHRAQGIADCEQRAALHGLGPLRWPERWPTSDLRAARGMVHAETRGVLKEFSLSAMRLAFLEGRDLEDPATVLEAGRRAGIESDELQRALGDQGVKDGLRSVTDEALALGVFGVPTVALGTELFWGDDRLDDAAQAYRALPSV